MKKTIWNRDWSSICWTCCQQPLNVHWMCETPFCQCMRTAAINTQPIVSKKHTHNLIIHTHIYYIYTKMPCMDTLNTMAVVRCAHTGERERARRLFACLDCSIVCESSKRGLIIQIRGIERCTHAQSIPMQRFIVLALVCDFSAASRHLQTHIHAHNEMRARKREWIWNDYYTLNGVSLRDLSHAMEKFNRDGDKFVIAYDNLHIESFDRFLLPAALESRYGNDRWDERLKWKKKVWSRALHLRWYLNRHGWHMRSAVTNVIQASARAPC